METSLHRQLKDAYSTGKARQEVTVDEFRIDVVRGQVLIEIQHGSLSAIRDKIARLLERRRVLIVKPLVARKTIIRLNAQDGQVVGQRLSPKQEGLLNIFDELVYFTRVFPHRRLTLEVVLVEIEEWRFPGHGRRRRWRRNDHETADQKLVTIQATHQFKTVKDLVALLPETLPTPFHSGHVAAALGIQRRIAQRVTYCLRKMNGITEVGKEGNAILYTRSIAKRRAA